MKKTTKLFPRAVGVLDKIGKGTFRRTQKLCRLRRVKFRRDSYLLTYIIVEVRGGAGGLDTELQVGRLRVRFPMVTLEFCTEIILPAALWPWGGLSLYQKTGIFPGVKAAGA